MRRRNDESGFFSFSPISVVQFLLIIGKNDSSTLAACFSTSHVVQVMVGISFYFPIMGKWHDCH
jgi:hypothetical protein